MRVVQRGAVDVHQKQAVSTRHGVVPRTTVDVSFMNVKDIQVFTGALEDTLSGHGAMHHNALVAKEKHRNAVFPSPTSTVAIKYTHHTLDICCNESLKVALILYVLLGETSLLVTKAELAHVGVWIALPCGCCAHM